ncbi:phosphotransferase [Sutcliffiella deserti]|uniref:phosphotransferase n=1 Tax=Sutcliffiella deserti TaxID=2875501 RepID=UPI001CBD4D1A|nr:phosphotransferase [Sutcliffiella deserti]
MLKTKDTMLDDILKTCYQVYGMEVQEALPIHRGYLNLKWKVRTASGNFLIKQFNKKRFQKYSDEELFFAFTQQQRLKEQGFPCPGLYPLGGHYLLNSEKNDRFMVMEFCNGRLLSPGTVKPCQMYELGKAAGRMHSLLNDGTNSKKSSPEFNPPSVKDRLNHWKNVEKKIRETNKLSLATIIETQIDLTVNVSLDDYNLRETGWAHRDLFLDNILFTDNGLSAILDFDRLKYDHPQLDVARAVISGALCENTFDISLASAFMEGYRVERPVEREFLSKALMFLWYMESTWWIEVDMDEHKGPPIRFTEEMVWLSEHYGELKEMLGGL